MIAESAAIGGYESEHLLRTAHGIASWLAYRHQDRQLCLLKCGQMEPARRLRFEHQARLAQALDPTISWTVQESRVIWSRGWRQGTPLSQQLPGRTWSPLELVELGIGWLRQLVAAHALGLVHGGIHPDNCVDGELLDFGFARGRPPYNAPQANLSWRAFSQDTDLHSVGAVLYQLASGKAPFGAGDEHELLRRQWENPPEPLRKLVPGYPKALEEILQRLLHQDPICRYAQAQATLDDFLRLHKALQTEPDPPLRLDTGFVVRLQELAQVQGHRQGLLLVVGASGSGKSTLLEEAARSHAGFSFRASGRSPRAPLQVLQELALDVVKGLAGAPERRTRMQQKLEEHRDNLLSVLPCLSELFDQPKTDAFTVQNHEYLLESLLAWLSALPGRIFLDDMQWADSLTWELLKRCPMDCCVVAALSDQEELAFAPVLRLGELNSKEVERLARSLLGGTAPHGFYRQLAEDCQGDLFLAVEMTRGFAETGGSLPCSSQRTGVLLSQRLAGLAQPTLDLLARAAVLGRQFRLSRLSGWSQGGERAALQPAVEAQLIWLLGDDEAVFAHDRLRDACLGLLPLDLQAQVHGQIAEQLESLQQQDPYALSYHFGNSQEPERAYPFALQAAQHALAHFAYDLAEEHFRLALRGGEVRRPAERVLVLEGLAEALVQRGRYAEAESLLQAALGEGDDEPLSRARRLARLGFLELSRGRLPEAADYARQALFSLGQKIPERPWQVVLTSGRAGLGALWNHLRKSSPRAPNDAQRLQLDLILQFTFLQFFMARPDLLLWGHLFSLEQAERFQDPSSLSSAYAMHSILLVTVAGYQKSEFYGTRSIELASSLSDRFLEARATMHRALGRLYSGRLEQAWQDYQRARQLGGRALRRWDENVIQQNEIHLLFQRGKLQQASRLAAELHQRGLMQRDRMAIAAALRYWVRCCGGRLPRCDFEEHGDQVARLYLDEVEGIRCYYQGRFEEAVKHLSRAVEIPAPAMEKATTWAWLVSAERRFRGMSRTRALRKALSLSRKFPLVAAHALREAAWEAARQGNTREAFSCIQSSLEQGVRLGQLYEQALSLQARARMGEVFGWSGRLDDESRSQQIFYEIEAWWELPATAQVGPGLADRYHQMLEKGAPIAASLSNGDARERLLEAARLLLRAERVELHDNSSELSLVRTALASGQAMIGGERQPNESEIQAGVRSSLACPLDSRLCLYASHSVLSDHFGEDELRLARFLTTLANTALRNVALHSELRQREEYFRALFYGPGMALAVVDRLGGVREENEAMTAVRRGQTLAELFHPNDLTHFQEVLQLHRQVSWEARYRGPGDIALWCQATLSPIQEGLSVLAISDVSYRKFRQIVLFAESERRLLGSELHDVISQPLFGLSLQLQELERNPSSELAAKTSRDCSELLERLGSLMTGLRTPPLAGIQLGNALEALLWRSGRDGGYEAELECLGFLEEVPELTAIFLYRIVQESLQNVTRHGGAQNVRVRLEASARSVSGTILDDGVGCDVAAALQSSRHGLRGMCERAELLGGWLRLSSPSGVLIEFELPGRQAL